MSTTTAFPWSTVVAGVRAREPERYRAWFEELPPPVLEAGELCVVVHDPDRLRYLREHCTEPFVREAMSVTGHLVTVRFDSGVGPAERTIASSARPALSRLALNPDYTFEQFVVGTSNRLPHAACLAICLQPGTLYNPLFIHGRSGLGKTHLLQAVCAEMARRDPPHEVIYVSCEALVNDLVRAMQVGQMQEFRDEIRRADLLVVDDIQFLSGRESSQEELFHTFNAVHQARKQIVLSADCAPSEIPRLEDRLVSRFNWGLVTKIDPPSRETRHAILRKKAVLRGCEFPSVVLDFIAEQVETDVRALEGALTKLISETTLGGRPMDLDVARQAVASVSGRASRTLHVNDILDAVSKYFGVKAADIIGRKRSRSVSHPRQVGMYLARKMTPLSLEEIGLYFGGRDHSTVLHAERTIDKDRQSDQRTADVVTALSRQLTEVR